MTTTTTTTTTTIVPPPVSVADVFIEDDINGSSSKSIINVDYRKYHVNRFEVYGYSNRDQAPQFVIDAINEYDTDTDITLPYLLYIELNENIIDKPYPLILRITHFTRHSQYYHRIVKSSFYEINIDPSCIYTYEDTNGKTIKCFTHIIELRTNQNKIIVYKHPK